MSAHDEHEDTHPVADAHAPPVPKGDAEVVAEASRAKPGLALVLGLLVVGGLVAIGVVPRLAQREALAKGQTVATAPRRVRVAIAKTGTPMTEVKLPATSSPLRSTQLFAKTTGFLRKNHVEVGDAVKLGQVLADVDSREMDQELVLAEARVAESKANMGIVQGTAERNADLSKQGVVSKQQADDTRAAANSAEATLKIRQADVERLRALRSYQKVVAPFDGTVLRRNVDPGALVGPAGAASVALFEIAAVDVLRVVVDVPQAFAKDITTAVEVQVYMPQTPNKIAKGKVARTSAALDPATRTRRTEIEIPGGEVLPNAFVYVKLALPKTTVGIAVPSAALIVRKEGTLVAKIQGDHVVLVPIEILRDQGKDLDLAMGPIVGGDRVVLNPADDLADGTKVDVAEGGP